MTPPPYVGNAEGTRIGQKDSQKLASNGVAVPVYSTPTVAGVIAGEDSDAQRLASGVTALCGELLNAARGSHALTRARVLQPVAAEECLFDHYTKLNA